MEKYPDIGKTCLYDGIIKDRLQKAGDMMLYNAIQNITSQYAQDKDAGLYTAILALDPERPFKSRGGKICKTAEDIADAIMAESAYYMEDLKKPNANLYLYLAATESSQGKEAADAFCKYFKEYSPKRALALVYLKLQSEGGITIGTKHYQSPDDLKHEKDSAQIALIKKAVTEKDSMLLVWLSDIYGDNLKSTDQFNNLNTLEQFFLLGLLPFLSFKEFNGDSRVLQDLIDSYPGRSDFFETYAAQGLPLTGQICGDKRTPIDYTVCNFSKLSKKHSADTIRNIIRLLCKLGADVNEYSGDGTCSLINAYNATDNSLVKLLLELGVDENQYREYLYNQLVQAKNRASSENEYRDLAGKFLGMNGYKDTKALADDCENQIRILKERRAEQDRVEQERCAEQKRKEQERIKAEERERRRMKKKLSSLKFLNILLYILSLISMPGGTALCILLRGFLSPLFVFAFGVITGGIMNVIRIRIIKAEDKREKRDAYFNADTERKFLFTLSLVSILSGIVLCIILYVLFADEGPSSNYWGFIYDDFFLQKNLLAILCLVIGVITGIIINLVWIKKYTKYDKTRNIVRAISLPLIPAGILIAIGFGSVMLGFGLVFIFFGVFLFSNNDGLSYFFRWPSMILGVILALVSLKDIF